jgi:hypothetical protein
MRNRRFRYRQERARNQRDGSMALVTYRLEQQEKAKKERWKPYNWHKRAGELIGKPIDQSFFGKGKRRRRRK